jgi:hypothetical protein
LELDKKGEERRIFERRGREGFAESAKKKIPKKYKNELILFFCYLNKFWLFFSFVFFCALCESLALSAFKNPPHSAFRKEIKAA